ncbi:MAG: hypothetical protein H6721_12910 [Sandaracinus sp.]|nr:hypothetical protein [Sandaracinus sp.]MCB9633015.1 hypothetical protein [Sandaracinus sp.]
MSAHDSDEHYDIDANAPHGFDDTPPRDQTILIWTVGSCLLLVALVPLFHSYFNSMTDGELSAKVQQRDSDGDGAVDYLAERNDAFAEARRSLTEAPVSLEAAMEQMVTQGRNVPAVRPRATDNGSVSVDDAIASLAAVEGWTLRKHEQERADAEAALLRARASEVVRRLNAAQAQAVDAKLDDDAATAVSLASSLRATATAESVTNAEAWLAAFAPRLAAARAAAPAP